MHFHIPAVLATTTLLLAPSLALPHRLHVRTPDCDTPLDDRQYATPGVTPEQLTQIYPQTASCNGADFPDECRDASQAADPINKSFEKYGLNTTGERAAALALMLYESGGFRYNRNHFPGRPGQGTRNMQMIDFNRKYATELFGEEKVSAANAEGENAVLELVLPDEPSFGSAAWFQATQCTEQVREGLRAGDQQGWANYLSSCVGVQNAEDRESIWRKAVAVLGGQ